MHLNYVAHCIVNANHRIMSATVEFRVADRITDCTRLVIPKPAEWQRIEEQHVLESWFRELVRDSFRQIKKQNAEDNVNGEKLDAFDPVGFAVAGDLKQDVNRSDYG